MSDDVWAERDTTPDEIDAALRRLLRDRHLANPTFAPARVLNLVVVVDRSWKGEISNRLARVGRYHASRTILCAVEDGRTTLDAVAAMSYDESPGGTLNVMHELVEIDIGTRAPRAAGHDHRSGGGLGAADDAVGAARPPRGGPRADADARRDPDGLRGSGGPAPAGWRARRTASSRCTWSTSRGCGRRRGASGSPRASIHPTAVARCTSSPACPFATRRRRGRAPRCSSAGWRRALQWNWQPASDRVGESVEQEAPRARGRDGVRRGDGCSLSLDRGGGGLTARQRGGGEDREWRVLGASRGEGGILGEGVRQALLRDPTYGPALDAATGLVA